MTPQLEMIAKWNQTAKSLMLDRKIIDVEYASNQEMQDLTIQGRPLIFTLDNGTSVIVMSDDEGNDAGALHMHTKQGKYEVLPSLW